MTFVRLVGPLVGKGGWSPCSRAPVVLGAVVGLLVPGCRDEHPFVPYSIEVGDTAAAPDAASGARMPGAVDAAARAVEDASATVAPAGLAKWTLDGVTVDAPSGQVFVLGIVADFDGDGAKDAFAVVQPSDGGSDWGQVAFYRGSSLASPTLFAPPVGLTSGSVCTRTARLVRVGPRSVLGEVGVTCPAAMGPDRWVVVLDAGKPRDAGVESGGQVRFAATIADPPGAPTLSVDAEVSDRDSDGQDDVALHVTLEGGGAPLEPGPRVAADFAWLQRHAGLSRERGVTEASFEAMAASAATRAAHARDAPTVPILVRQARALWRAMCGDGGAARFVPVTATGEIVCGMGQSLAALAVAESRAYVTMGDAVHAGLALDRAQRTPAVATAGQLAEGQRQITQIAPVLSARGVRAIAAVPAVRRGHEPAWGSLAFETSGRLLVRTAAGIVRVDPEPGDEVAASGVDWKDPVTSPDGSLVWIEAYDPCDGLSLRATFAPSSGDDVREVALPVAPPLGGRCVGSRGASARVIPIAWGAGGLEAFVEGDPVLIASDLGHASLLASYVDEPSHPGAPRSPDGKTYVVASRVGLIVRGPTTGAHVLRAKVLDGTYSEQEGCVVSDDATHVACVHDGKAWVGAWGAENLGASLKR